MSKKTYMTRCPHEGCYELMPVDANGCDNHKNTARKCAEAGCGKEATGLQIYCTDCKRLHRQQTVKHSRKRVIEAYEQVEVMVPKRRTPVKIVKTSTQVDRECRKEERRLAEVREMLNQDLLAHRMMGRAICEYRV